MDEILVEGLYYIIYMCVYDLGRHHRHRHEWRTKCLNVKSEFRVAGN